MAYRKTHDELWIELREQLAALGASCASFDNGCEWEARRIAAAIYMLFHDRGRNAQSLLTHLGLKSGLQMLSCCQVWSDTSLITQMPLVALKMAPAGASYVALLDDTPVPPALLPWSKWWEQPVLRDTNRREISRKNLVFSIRDQDGGAHVDSSLRDESYVAISREDGAGWHWRTTEGSKPLRPGPHFATMRQIAWEAQKSLEPILLLRSS